MRFACGETRATLTNPAPMRTILSLCALALFALVAMPTLAAPADHSDPAMAYCAASDLTDRYTEPTIAELTGDASGQIVNQDRVEDAIDDAATEIEAAVVTQYGESLVERELPYLRKLNAEGAYLMLRQRQVESLGEKDSSHREDLARWDRKLDRIADGTLKLLSADALAEDTNGDGVPGPRITFRSRERLFGGVRHAA